MSLPNEEERRQLAAMFLGVQINNEGALFASSAAIDSAFKLADEMMAFPALEEGETEGEIFQGRRYIPADTPEEELAETLVWFAKTLHKKFHGDGADWRICHHANCRNSRERMEKLVPGISKTEKPTDETEIKGVRSRAHQ